MKCAIIGASGYTGAELAALIQGHPQLELVALYVSGNSEDAHKPLAALHRQYLGVIDLPLTPLPAESVADAADGVDCVFLALDHKVSHAVAPQLLAKGVVVFDLSGAYRFDSIDPIAKYYGFEHQHPEWNDKAVYGLAEWNADAVRNAQLVAVPGCYPTASLLALKPLQQGGFIKPGSTPVINAISGVTGAGRKASMVNSFCEVSLNPYGVLTHRHQPEIALHLGNPVLFTPHLGNFPRGIVATIAVELAEGSDADAITEAYRQAYQGKPAVRLLNLICPGSWPSINAVAKTPYCDIAWKVSEDGRHLIVCSAIDNLLKGASSQALQCANIKFGLSNYPFSAEVA